MIGILVVDDQRVIREGLKALLEPESDLHVVGDASNGRKAVEQVETLRPDIVLIDIEMPEMDGLTATQVITHRFTETKVLVLSSHDDEEYLNKALEAGAKGYLLKDIAAAELSYVIKAVHRGYAQSRLGLTERISQTTTIKALILEQAPSELRALVSDLETVHQELAGFCNQLERHSVNMDSLTKAQARFEKSSVLKEEFEEKLAVVHSRWTKDKQTILTALDELETNSKRERVAFEDELCHWLLGKQRQELDEMRTRLTLTLWLVFLVLGISVLLFALRI